MSVDQDFERLLRGCEAVYTREALLARLQSGQRMRVKLGMDPTAPDLHLGHTVVLSKLRQFQDLGHQAVLIIGDYTAKIGDPTGKSKTRPALDDDAIKANAATYMAQAGKILDLSAEKLEVRYNSEWLGPMQFADVIKLMAQMTVARMLERDTFEKRQKAGKEIYLHELLYPLMQAQDSVAVRSDVELGGTDQTFNNLCGRDLQRNAGQPPQLVLVMPILVGIDGHEKMSKSLGNAVGVTDDPGDMFGKIMRVPDDIMGNYFELLTDVPAEEIARLVDAALCNPRDTKELLAKTIIARFHSPAAADAAAAEFRRVHGGGGGGLPDDVPEVALPAELVRDGCIAPVDLLTHLTFATSRKDARRLVAEGGARLNGETLGDALRPIAVKTGDVVQRGKRRFVRLIVG
ncbi:MAG: tyrosine--tRNA ligase [Phycisphaerae bacterium]